MRSAALFALLALAAPALAQEALDLNRGIGVHEWLNWAPVEANGTYKKPLYQTVDQWRTRYRDLSDWPEGDEFVRIRNMSFDFVRLTIDPGPLLANDGADRAEGLAVLEDAVRQVTDAGLKVVFDYHLVPQVEAFGQEAMEGPVDAPQLDAFRNLLTETAVMLVGIGIDKVALEPMNEPQYYPCDGWAGIEWQEVMGSFVQTIRAVSTDLTIIASGACGGGAYGLLHLDPSQFNDPAILYSLHMYEPHRFTHQGVGDTSGLTGLPWPSDLRSTDEVETITRDAMERAGLAPAEQNRMLLGLRPIIEEYFAEGYGQAELEQGLDEVLGWADKHGIAADRLFIGEFGVSRFSADRGGALDDDRFRYLRAVREMAERHGIAWSMWEYSNPHGITLIDPDGAALPEPGTLDALGLAPN